MSGHAVKIIEIAEGDQTFSLNEDALKKILYDIPEGTPIAIVSVVGAFRTGKSFILDFFLRYLKSGEQGLDEAEDEPSQAWLNEFILSGNQNADLNKGQDAMDASRKRRINEGGFGWRSGKDRCTTGIWMWNQVFPRTLPNGEVVSVLLVDTQGMFDSTLGQMLTASIFGLSTLISSYQVYNVDKRIQEDNLQHLALFAEYGRVALTEERALAGKGESAETPFQRLEFLVRDWQSFDDEGASLSVLRKDMNAYLEQVLENKDHKDLKQVREQIAQCFEVVSCYLLPHPGLEVPNKSYDGAVDKIRPEFRRMLSDYVRHVFTQRLVPKRIHGRSVTGPELFNFIKAYCKLFREAKIFPEAKTLLAATAEANNRCAVELALKEYAAFMDQATRKYVEELELNKLHADGRERALHKYKKAANLGPKEQIASFLKQLEADLAKQHTEYQTLNRLRDPFGFVAPYIVPILIAIVAYVLRYATDLVCSPWSQTCATSGLFLGQLYSTVFFFMLIHLVATGHGVMGRLETMFAFVKNRAT